MQNQWETDIMQREVSRITTNDRTRDRWGIANDAQIPSFDSSRSTTSPSGK